MNTQQTDIEQDEQALSWFDIQDELDAMKQAILDYEELESQRLWEEHMERARTQSTSSDEEEEEEQKPATLIGRKRRYSEIEQSDSEEEEEDSDDDSEDEEEEDGVGNCGFRCDGRCRWCESGGYDPRDEA